MGGRSQGRGFFGRRSCLSAAMEILLPQEFEEEEEEEEERRRRRRKEKGKKKKRGEEFESKNWVISNVSLK